MKKLQIAGDTIIEVILAMALLSLVLFSSWSITNRASQISLTARQRVEMVNQLKEQAELLKSKWSTEAGKNDINAQLASVVNDIPSNPCTGIDIYDTNSQPSSPGYFVVESPNPPLVEEVLTLKAGSKQVKQDITQRVWIQRQDNPSGGYTDFYVRGCWLVSGSAQNKLDNSQLIVRLNT